MQPQSDVVLDVRPSAVSDLFVFLEDLARGKRVLNVGATGGVEHYLPHARDTWLHLRLRAAARDLIGIDIDEDSIGYAAKHGVDIQFADAEHFTSEPFDLVVLSDVIEHLDSLVPTIRNLVSLLTPGGTLAITTPNPTHLGVVLRAWFGPRVSIYSDHTAMLMPEHIQVIANRIGAKLTKVSFFTHIDRRTGGMVLKSSISRLLGWLMPRSNGSLLVCVQRGTL